MSGLDVPEDRRWPTFVGVGVLTFLVGAGVARIGPVWRSAQRLDGASVIENLIGSGIPLAATAAIGVLIGRKLSFNSALDLHKAVSDLDDQRQSDQNDAELRWGLRRQRLWTQLKIAAGNDALRYSDGWQGLRSCHHPITELRVALPAVASAIDALVDDGVIGLEETASKLRAIIAAIPAAQNTLDAYRIEWSGNTFVNLSGAEERLWRPTLQGFDRLGDAVREIEAAAHVHSVHIEIGPPTSAQLTMATDAVDRCFQQFSL